MDIEETGKGSIIQIKRRAKHKTLMRECVGTNEKQEAGQCVLEWSE